MRHGLAHPSRGTRLEAARAIGRRGGGALAMPLLAALEIERDGPTWQAMLLALARIEAPEAAAALASMALKRRGMLSRGGFTHAQRMEVVSALAAAPTRAARQALARVAREGDRDVGAAARRALERPGAETSAG
jgi:HEAT repeat protein